MALLAPGLNKATGILREKKMADDSNTHNKTRHDPTVIPCEAEFDKARENAAAITRARRHAALTRQRNIQKRLVMRVLNKERKKPHLHVVK
ncbi:MAG: hypothetical protein OEY45_09035 [Gammaproteobacteria bacterium]|nr:hypothetical protein [Gammaproteobacteria bacterium]MDH5515291.1 hypothetical protein [Gammaproteobacteria bacterium]